MATTYDLSRVFLRDRGDGVLQAAIELGAAAEPFEPEAAGGIFGRQAWRHDCGSTPPLPVVERDRPRGAGSRGKGRRLAGLLRQPARRGGPALSLMSGQ